MRTRVFEGDDTIVRAVDSIVFTLNLRALAPQANWQCSPARAFWPPAYLPGFKGLARQIAEPKVPWDDAYEAALDRYLGRATREGVKCPRRARAFSTRAVTHAYSMRICSGSSARPERVRLITTNFDRHFSAAAERVFPDAVLPLRRASASSRTELLWNCTTSRRVGPPQGLAGAHRRRLRGRLHGGGVGRSVLVRVFAERTVLFVGSSLGDPPAQYLLHALPPTGRWYAPLA